MSDREGMRPWFYRKFTDNVSDIRPEQEGYYKHHVHHFITSFFTPILLEGKTVLDLGCGPGFYSAILARRASSVVGIDKSRFLIDKALTLRRDLGLTNVRLHCGDFCEVAADWQSDLFDYVVIIDTLVSLDFSESVHQHAAAVAVLCLVSRLLKPTGTCLVVESHPCFGRAIGTSFDAQGREVCLCRPGYKIEHRESGDPHHWFTLEEMTTAAADAGLALRRIREPEPSIIWRDRSAEAYNFRLKYPGMIVYEFCHYSGRQVRPGIC